VVAGAGTTGAGELALTTEVADGPQVGKFGFASACDAVTP
jgi:hypothetical protein